MMSDLSRCPSLQCAWCSLTLDMLRPLSPMYTLPHSQKCGKHQHCLVCPVCTCVSVVMLESCLVPCGIS